MHAGYPSVVEDHGVAGVEIEDPRVVFHRQLVFPQTGVGQPTGHERLSIVGVEDLSALAWLATDYHRVRSDGGGDTANLDKAIKEACPGWSYIPHQSAVTIGKFKDWYFTEVDGRKHELAEHVGRGSSGNPQHTIRIAFAWDNDAKKVIVGYVGHHQRSQRS